MNRDGISFSFYNLSKYRKFLMGIAILLVVFHHLTFHYEAGILGKVYSFLRVEGAFGVDIFLLLSGIGLYFSFSKDENIKAFYKRRFIRIIPTYLLILTPIYFYQYVVQQNDLIGFALHISLLSFWIDGSADWYIAAILVFYILFPFFYHFRTTKKMFFLLCGWGVMCFLLQSFVPHFFSVTSRFWARVPIFLVGVYMGAIVKDKKQSLYISKFLTICFCVNLLCWGVEAYFALLGPEAAYSFFARLIYAPLSFTFVILCCSILSFFDGNTFVEKMGGENRYQYNSLNDKKMYIFIQFLGGITLEIYLLNQKVIEWFSTSNVSKVLAFENFIGVIVTIILSYAINQLMSKIVSRVKKPQQSH